MFRGALTLRRASNRSLTPCASTAPSHRCSPFLSASAPLSSPPHSFALEPRSLVSRLAWTSQLDLSANQLCGLNTALRPFIAGLTEGGTYTTEGITAIADAIKWNAGSLTKIVLDSNSLRNEGTTILCDALRERTVSKALELSLANNGIELDGAMALCAVVGLLARLDGQENSWGEKGEEALSKAVEGRSGFKLGL